MNKIAKLSDSARKELFQETASRMNVHSSVVEKDFWVCWTLAQLFSSQVWSSRLIFKGGTSLSKVFGLISRFSEDIDLILDWQAIGITNDDAWEKRSTNQSDKYNKTINKLAGEFIRDKFVPELRKELSLCGIEGIAVQTDAKDSATVNVFYPRCFDNSSILPSICLEIGPLASWIPHNQFYIKPYAAEYFPAIFEESNSRVRAILAERTFWEKVTILHKEAHRSIDKIMPPRQARHYYDLAMMIPTNVKNTALADLKLLSDVVAFKKQFYPCHWAEYELAKPGTLRLLPNEIFCRSLENDYKAMQSMIFGKVPTFQEIISRLKLLENEINLS